MPFFIHLFTFLCLTLFLSLSANAIEPSFSVTGNSTFRGSDMTLDPGFAVEGGVRFNRFLGAGMGLDYYQLNNADKGWFLLWVLVDLHLTDFGAKWDPYITAGVGDSIYQSRQGVAITGRAGLNYWIFEKVGVNLTAQYIRTFGIAAVSPRHPDFSSGAIAGGFRVRF